MRMMRLIAYLVTDDWFLDGGKIFQWREQNMPERRSSDILDEFAQLLAQGD